MSLSEIRQNDLIVGGPSQVLHPKVGYPSSWFWASQTTNLRIGVW